MIAKVRHPARVIDEHLFEEHRLEVTPSMMKTPDSGSFAT
jgi:hypothetical protein